MNIKGKVLVLMGRQQISIQQNKHTHTQRNTHTPKNGYPLQYSYLENFMDRGARQTAVHGVTKSWTCNIYHELYIYIGIPSGTSGKESTCQCGRHKGLGFDPWIGKISWRRAWQWYVYIYVYIYTYITLICMYI